MVTLSDHIFKIGDKVVVIDIEEDIMDELDYKSLIGQQAIVKDIDCDDYGDFPIVVKFPDDIRCTPLEMKLKEIRLVGPLKIDADGNLV